MKQRTKNPQPVDKYEHPTGRVPRSVHVVALGRTCVDYVRHGLSKRRERGDAPEEVWTVNRGLRVFKADLAFVLDDLENECRQDPSYAEYLKAYDRPIITTTAYPSVRMPVRYPSAAIQAHYKRVSGADDPYWHNSIPMVLAYAWHIGVRDVVLWGADYTLDDGRVLEADRANCEFWCGWCRAQGMRVGVPTGSSLLNTALHQGLHVYGLLDQTSAWAWMQQKGTP